jgi:hypothetical protein
MLFYHSHVTTYIHVTVEKPNSWVSPKSTNNEGEFYIIS